MIGVFDGVHRGHQAMIADANRLAQDRDTHSLAITFEPYPLEVLAPHAPPSRLTTLREKVGVMAQCGVEQMAVLRFNAALAGLSPEAFARDILRDELAIQAVIVGEDFRFGKRGAGDFGKLKELGRFFGFEVFPEPTRLADGGRISSSRIRAALKDGQVEIANDLLGRPYHVSGRVGYGRALGRELGFPTANINLGRTHAPISGIFVVEVRGLANRPLPAVASVGTRPTVGGEGVLLEVHILDFSEDIYGRLVHVDFLKHIRGERHFASIAELVQNIYNDAQAARLFFSTAAAGRGGESP